MYSSSGDDLNFVGTGATGRDAHMLNQCLFNSILVKGVLRDKSLV